MSAATTYWPRRRQQPQVNVVVDVDLLAAARVLPHAQQRLAPVALILRHPQHACRDLDRPAPRLAGHRLHLAQRPEHRLRRLLYRADRPRDQDPGEHRVAGPDERFLRRRRVLLPEQLDVALVLRPDLHPAPQELLRRAVERRDQRLLVVVERVEQPRARLVRQRHRVPRVAPPRHKDRRVRLTR
jgi:hypothetical protein